jgi:hypothetical protein
MIYFIVGGWTFSACMTEYGLAVYDQDGVETFDLYVVEQAYQAYDGFQEAA